MSRYTRVLCAAAAALLTGACAGRAMRLPAGPGAPAQDAPDALARATAACRAVSSFAAVASVRGSVGGQRLRGNIEAGLAAPASARLEALAPFGQPVFIFVARGQEATLLLPRDRRVLMGGRPDAVLEAVAGVPLDAADLRLALTGCAPAGGTTEGASVGDEWRIVRQREGKGERELYLRRQNASGPWRLVAAVRRGSDRPAWRAEYRDFADGLPRSVRLTSVDREQFDIRLTLSQVDVKTPLDPSVFQLTIGEQMQPITLEELRQSGPLAGAAAAIR